MDSPLRLYSTRLGKSSDGSLRLQLDVENTASDTLHIFDSARMPYLLLQEDGSLLVLHGVHAPDPDIDYPLIEIPVTQALAPGIRWETSVALAPLILADHYQKSGTVAVLKGAVTVHFHLAWGRTPIRPADRVRTSITALLAWQNWAAAEPLTVDFD